MQTADVSTTTTASFIEKNGENLGGEQLVTPNKEEKQIIGLLFLPVSRSFEASN